MLLQYALHSGGSEQFPDYASYYNEAVEAGLDPAVILTGHSDEQHSGNIDLTHNQELFRYHTMVTTEIYQNQYLKIFELSTSR